MMQVLRLLSWWWYLTTQIVIGSWNVAVAAWRPKPMAGPAIVEYPMRATTDFEIAMFASAITITPGTLVLGICPGDETRGPSVFVHSLFDSERASVIGGLAELEWHLLHALRRHGMPKGER